MGNTDGPSRACSSCKKWKIRCDLEMPARNKCIKARWTCPGVLSEADIRFRHHSGVTLKKPQANLSSKQSELSNPGSGRMKRHVSPPLEDRATAFFFSRFVLNTNGDPQTKRGVCEFLPELLQQKKTEGVLGTIIPATGLSTLVNAGKSLEWKSEAFALCGKALRQLIVVDLGDAVKARSDHTLAAIMLMGTFEVSALSTIASADADSMKSFSHHTIAAARCIELRGPIIVQMRRIIVIKCHQLQVPLPYVLSRWSSWAQPIQSVEDTPSNRFSEINELLAVARAEMKHKCISDPCTVAAMLLLIDAMLVAWARDLPDSWAFNSYQHLGSADAPVASFHSYYRSVRLLVREAIMSATLRYDTPGDRKRVSRSAKVLVNMANGICHSVPYHLGFKRIGVHTKKAAHVEAPPSPGGCLLLWPLFFSGMLRTTSKNQRAWIASTLRQIGLGMGIQLAISMAEALEQKALSFSDKDTWSIGEFNPY
ncbi:hypothetical protein BKA60DRAFT_613420 [Fusarium oxysporum]|nr:hypothetical protein BKA60DRAFT_613420 [Fusarium oxysporum]